MTRCRQHLEDDDFDLAPRRVQSSRSRVRTWMVEVGVVAAVLLVVAIASGKPIELFGAAAVALSFAHAQVSERMAEREAWRLVHTHMRGRVECEEFVHCAHWSGRYFIAKEILWCVYFVAHGSWSALAGVALFLAYPLWRRWWRRRHPMRLR